MPSDIEILERAKAVAEESMGSFFSAPLPLPKCSVCGAPNARWVNVTITADSRSGELLEIGPMKPACGDCCHKPPGF